VDALVEALVALARDMVERFGGGIWWRRWWRSLMEENGGRVGGGVGGGIWWREMVDALVEDVGASVGWGLEKWSRRGAAGMVGQSTCMPHVVHDANKVCWLLACPEERLDIPRGVVMLGWWSRGRVCTQKAKRRFLRREKWFRPDAVGIVGLSLHATRCTCCEHSVLAVGVP
jgi:hypothetical protein